MRKQLFLCVARGNLIYKVVLQRKFRLLEFLGQGLARGLFNCARTGKADRRARLGQKDIGLHGKAGRHAASGRVGQNRNIEQLCIAVAFDGCAGLGHLHHREQAFLHARAAGEGERHHRHVVFQRIFKQQSDLFAHHSAMEPIMNCGSITNRQQLWPPMRAVPQTMVSSSSPAAHTVSGFSL